jgi:hypothetical protein
MSSPSKLTLWMEYSFADLDKKAAKTSALPFGDALPLAACSRSIREPSY